MSVMTRGGFANEIPAVGLQLAEFFDQGLNIYQPGFSNVLTQTTGAGAQKNFESMTTAGELKKVNEGESVSTLSRSLGYLTQVRYTEYGGALEVTRTMLEDRDFESVFNEATALGRAANYSMDRAAMQLFNGGFATTTSVNGYDMNWYGDAKATFSTAHPTKVPGASTQSNASATGVTFGMDNLETAHVALIQQKTDDGIPTGYAGKPMIVVPSKLVREATEITGSELTPESNYNAINVFRGRFDVASSLFIDATNGGSDTAWFLVTPGQDKQFMEIRRSPSIEMEKAVKTGTQTFVVTSRFAPWVGDWRMKWGSKGDGQAYAG